MEKELLFYWQKLSQKFPQEQVLNILGYWMLSAYQQCNENIQWSGKKEDQRAFLCRTLNSSDNYDVMDAALKLGYGIDWELLDDDMTAGILTDFQKYACSRLQVGRNAFESGVPSFEDRENCLLQMTEALFGVASVNGVYSATPESIKSLIAGLAESLEITGMMDLCCGSGGLGIRVWQSLKSHRQVSYHGIEIDPVLCDICTIVTYLCGISDSKIRLQDVLEACDDGENDRYDLVLLDVPKGQNRHIQISDENALLEGISLKNVYTDWYYMLQALEKMNDRGKGFMIATSGALTRKNDSGIRKKLISKDWLEAVITLPANLYSNTRVGSELIVFNKAKKAEYKNKVFFMDISEYSVRNNRNYCSISQEGICFAVENYLKNKNGGSDCCLKNDTDLDHETWSLKPLRYIDMHSEGSDTMICMKDVAQVIRGVQLRREEEEYLCQSGDALFLNVRDIQDGDIRYEGAKPITPKSKDWHVKFAVCEDDIVITSKGSVIKMALVEAEPPEAYICGNLTILRVHNKKYHPYVLYEYLNSEKGRRMLESVQSGTTIRVLSNGNLQEFKIPLFEEAVMKEVGDQLKEKRKRYKSQLRALQENYKNKRSSLLKKLQLDS